LAEGSSIGKCVQKKTGEHDPNYCFSADHSSCLPRYWDDISKAQGRHNNNAKVNHAPESTTNGKGIAPDAGEVLPKL
jgi:hypothetical protein